LGRCAFAGDFEILTDANQATQVWLTAQPFDNAHNSTGIVGQAGFLQPKQRSIDRSSAQKFFPAHHRAGGVT
jgi:hypothetical protein